MRTYIKIGLAILATCSTAQAFTVNQNEFFAYAYHPQYRAHILLSHDKCPLTGKGWSGYAQFNLDVSKASWDGCWSWYDKEQTTISVCRISIKENVAHDCIYLGKDRFQDVTSLPKSAF